MTQTPITQPAAQDWLAQVRDGMRVHDGDGKEVGRVDGLFMGVAADQYERPGVIPETAQGAEPLVDEELASTFGELFAPDSRLPEVLRRRLHYNGFLAIKGGLLRGTRYALREHVAAVSGDEVRLNIPEDELIKPM
jgi:hypothetical protein